MKRGEFRGIVAGMVLGDGNLQVQKKSINPSIRFNHSSKQREYAKHKIALLQPKFHYSLMNNYSEAVVSNKDNGKQYKICRFASRVNPKLKTVYKLAYPNGKKTVTRELLDMLTPHGIAIWYMDDGCLNWKARVVIISMYTEYEQVAEAQKYFAERWNIHWHIGKHKERYFLVRGIQTEDIRKFMKLVEPFLIPSMRYKHIFTAPASRNER